MIILNNLSANAHWFKLREVSLKIGDSKDASRSA